MAGTSALLIGATGATGKHILTELLAAPLFTRVGEYGRRVTPGVAHAKLEQRTVDFENIADARLGEGRWDVVIIALGTTRARAGSAFEKIDREYVLDAARAARTDDAAHAQRLVYISASSANASSPFLYPRSKGLTENGLAALGYSDTIIFRPGFLANAERADPRFSESIVAPITGALSRVFSNIQIDVSVLAKSVRIAAQLGSTALPAAAGAFKAGPGNSVTVIKNQGAIALAKTESTKETPLSN